MEELMKKFSVLWAVPVILLILGLSMACKKAPDETVTITVTATINEPGPSGVYDDPVTQYIEKTLGIKLELNPVDDGSYGTQLPAMVAAGDLPDIFTTNAGDGIQVGIMLKEAQAQLDLKPYLEQYATRTKNDPVWQYWFREAAKITDANPEGKILAWSLCKGSWNDGSMPTTGHYILWDVYKKAGYPKLESFDDDLLDVLEKMVAVQPTSISGEKTYGTGAWFGAGQGWGDWVLTYGLAPQEGGWISAVPLLVANNTNATFFPENQLTDSNSFYWRLMKFYNRANQRGLLDPDSFIQSSDVYQEKVVDARYMFNIPGWMAQKANNTFATQPGNEHWYISLPSLSADAEDRFSFNYGGERQYSVSSKTKYPERCVELLDFISTIEFSRIAINGVEGGGNWNMVNGKPVPTDEYLAAVKDKVFGYKTGAGVFHHFLGYGGGTVDPATGIPLDLYNYSSQASQKNLNDTVKDFIAYYNQTSLMDVYLNETSITRVLGGPVLPPEIPEDITDSVNGLNAYLYKNYVTVIAAKTDAEYEREKAAFIAGMAPYNLDRIYNFYYDYAVANHERALEAIRNLPQL
jgi:ABC-type glycerol-3-phosphate transport system substrate-binding protein